jgi:predicted phosphodiesterase
MQTAIISDIHANLEALNAVLDQIKKFHVDETVCLGDVVGYNANPNECVEILRSKKITCILGNHDAAATGLEEPDHFNVLARSAVLWTRVQLKDENKQFLLDLPRERSVRDFFTFHGSIHDGNRYILRREDAVDNFRELATLPDSPVLGFFGHTHIMTIVRERLGVISASVRQEELLLHSDTRYLINPGSVGQPRDGDPRAAFLVYDDSEHIISFHRVAYDMRLCQEKVINAGLPPELAERLAWGR